MQNRQELLEIIQRGKVTSIPLINNSGVTIEIGDAVIWDSAQRESFTTTVEQSSIKVVGISLDQAQNGKIARIATNGIVEAQITGSVAIGDYLRYSAISKRLESAGQIASAGCCGLALAAGSDTRIPILVFANYGIGVAGSSNTYNSYNTYEVSTGTYVGRVASYQAPSGSTFMVPFDYSHRDELGAWNISAPNKLTVLESGWYTLSFSLNYDSNTTGRRVLDLRVNGVVFMGTQNFDPDGSVLNPTLSSSFTFYLNAGDYVEFGGFQDSGGNRAVTAMATLVRIG